MKMKLKKIAALGLTLGTLGLSVITANAEVTSITTNAGLNTAGSINLGKGTALLGNPYYYKAWVYGSNAGKLSANTAYFSVGTGSSCTNVMSKYDLARSNGSYETKDSTRKSQANIKIYFNNQQKTATSYAN